MEQLIILAEQSIEVVLLLNLNLQFFDCSREMKFCTKFWHTVSMGKKERFNLESSTSDSL